MNALVRRPVAWIERWHGGQVLTLWVACTVGPWRIAAWRQALLMERLRAFADPGAAASPATRLGLGILMFGLPLLALAATVVWVRGRRALRPAAPGGVPAKRT